MPTFLMSWVAISLMYLAVSLFFPHNDWSGIAFFMTGFFASMVDDVIRIVMGDR